jgi:hypothetical protein
MGARRGIALLALCLVACQNAGQDRAFGVEATGLVKGIVYFDRDGNQVLDAADTILSGIKVSLVIPETRDTVARAASDSAGLFQFSAVPVGTVVISVDSTSIPGDSLHVTKIDLPTVTVTPGDSFVVHIAVSYLQTTIAQARTVAVGTKLFVVGVALAPSDVFGDTTLHIADTSAAIVLTHVLAVVQTGDSVRWLGTRQTRNGQPTLANPVGFGLGTGAVPPTDTVTAGVAANARGGALDAALVAVLGATVADTMTVAGNLHLTVNDGSGPLTVQLDTVAGFSGLALAPDTVGATLDVYGVLVPTGTGSWVLLPRAPADVTAP